MDTSTIVVLEGDETGQELLEEALRVLAPDVVGTHLELSRFDLSLANRRATKNAISGYFFQVCETSITPLYILGRPFTFAVEIA